MKSPAHRNLDAEVRAVEEGHRAFVVAGPGRDPHIRVVSDTYEGEGKFYRIDVPPVGLHCPITFICQPDGYKAFEKDHMVLQGDPGVTACKHAALAARRMEREGLAHLLPNGLWIAVAPLVPEGKCETCGGPTRDEGKKMCSDCKLKKALKI